MLHSATRARAQRIRVTTAFGHRDAARAPKISLINATDHIAGAGDNH
jgi:hypothetical protein